MATLDHALFPSTMAAALGSGLMAGLFFSFSNFVMKALSKLPARESISAMQSINEAVLNPIFLGIFLRTAALSLLLIVCALARWEHPSALWWLGGGMLYVFGTLLVTIAGNVPL